MKLSLRKDIIQIVKDRRPYLRILKINSPHDIIVKCTKCGYGPWSTGIYSLRCKRKYSICPRCKAYEYRDKYHKNKKILTIKHKFGILQVFWQCKIDGYKNFSSYSSFCSTSKISCMRCFNRKINKSEDQLSHSINVTMYEMADSMIKPPSLKEKHDCIHTLSKYIHGYASNYLKQHHLSILPSIKNVHGKLLFKPECILIGKFHDFKYYKNKIYIKIICRRCQTKFYALIHNLIHHKIVCPYCSQHISKGELATIKYLNDIGLPEFDGRSAHDLSELNKHVCGFKYRYISHQLHRLHLDLIVKLNDQYYPIEYDGYQHSHPVNIFGGKAGYDKLHKNDLLKDKLCEHTYGRPPIRIRDKTDLESFNDVWQLVRRTLNEKFLPIYLKNYKIGTKSYNFITSNVKPAPKSKSLINPAKRRKIQRTKKAKHIQKQLYRKSISNPKCCIKGLQKHLNKLKYSDKSLYKMENLALQYLINRTRHVHGRIFNLKYKDEAHHCGYLEAEHILEWFRGHSHKEQVALQNKISKFNCTKYSLAISYLYYTSALKGLFEKYNFDSPLIYTKSQIRIIYLSGMNINTFRNDIIIDEEYLRKYHTHLDII